MGVFFGIIILSLIYIFGILFSWIIPKIDYISSYFSITFWILLIMFVSYEFYISFRYLFHEENKIIFEFIRSVKE